jgi:epoxyqueuosine reductase
MNYYNLNREIKSKALKLGFSFCGISLAKPLDKQREFYTDFIKNKKHGQFRYLETNLEKRLDPKLVLPEIKSVIALLLNYYPPEIIPEKDNYIIAKYAYGKDYPPVLKEKMNDLVHFIKDEYPDLKARSFVDSGPVMEKFWAQPDWDGREKTPS